MKSIIFLSIILCSVFNFSYSDIKTYEGQFFRSLNISIEGNIYINLSSYPNNEYIFIEISHDDRDFENYTYALKNETNFTNLTNVDFYRKYIKFGNKRYYYTTFQKLNNYNYLLIYFNLGYLGRYSIYISLNNYPTIPKYGSAKALYNAIFFMNLTEFKMSENIYIQVQFNTTANYSRTCLDISQSDYFGIDRNNYHIECSTKLIKNNISYTFFFNFTKKKDYCYLDTNIYHYINVTLKNTKTDEYPKKKEKNKNKNKDSGFTKTHTIALVITLITAIILIIVSIYMFVIRPSKNINIDYIENLK